MIIHIPDSPILDVVVALVDQMKRIGLILFGKIVLEELLILNYVWCLGLEFFAFACFFALDFF